MNMERVFFETKGVVVHYAFNGGKWAFHDLNKGAVSNFSRFHVFQLDLEDFSSIQAFAAKIEENFAGVHVLVNNAGPDG